MLVWDSGAVPVVVLTKADLSVDVDAAVADAEAVALGVDVLAVSGTNGRGLDRLRRRVGPGRSFVLVGASGTGKSTLVNALAGEERQATGDVRAGDRRGRHTTTAGELVVLAGGAILIDTPGIRSVGLWAEHEEEGLASTFADVEELAEACRFPDCAHDREPGCAVRGCVDDGRLASWRRLRRELARTAGDRAGWERAEANKQLRARMRSHKSIKPRPWFCGPGVRFASAGSCSLRSAIGARSARRRIAAAGTGPHSDVRLHRTGPHSECGFTDAASRSRCSRSDRSSTCR